MTTPALGGLISVALPTVTTPGRRLPRGGGGIYSDNSDEAAGATLYGGETGGTWTKAGELLTGRPDGGLAVFVAEVPAPADLGGSAKPEPDHAGELGQPDLRVHSEGQAGPIHHPEIGTQIGTELAARGEMG